MNRVLLYVLLLPCCAGIIATTTCAQECTIYTIPSPKGINWKSPSRLLFSYVSNMVCRSRYKKEKHPIGHMIVELKDSNRHALVGVSNVHGSGMSGKVLRKGYGLGILFSTISGTIEENDKNMPQVAQRCETGDIAFITYKINRPVFDRLLQYLHEYKVKGYHLNYNGWNKPREGLGAGCSAFAVSFLEVGGLTKELPPDEWKVQVTVPNRLLGGKKTFARSVQFIKLLFARHWAAAHSKDGLDLVLYEPTLLYQWIVKKHNSALPQNVSKTTKGKAPGLIVDCTQLPVPAEPIWKD